MSNNNGNIDQHLSLEHGNINYKNLIKEISKSGWHGIVALETRNVRPKKSLQYLFDTIDAI